MAYDPRPSASGDTLVASRDAIRTNFTSLETVLNANHVDIDASGEGKHKFLQMPEQSSAPTTAANEGGLYTKEANSVSCLFFRQESSGTEIQLTTSKTPSAATNGYSFLPGGLLIQWGVSGSIGSAAQATVTFPTAFSAAPYSVQLTPRYTSIKTIAFVVKASPSSTSFIAMNSSEVSTVTYWMAIGPA